MDLRLSIHYNHDRIHRGVDDPDTTATTVFYTAKECEVGGGCSNPVASSVIIRPDALPAKWILAMCAGILDNDALLTVSWNTKGHRSVLIRSRLGIALFQAQNMQLFGTFWHQQHLLFTSRRKAPVALETAKPTCTNVIVKMWRKWDTMC